MRPVPNGCVTLPRHAFRADDDHFAWSDVVQINRTNQIESACLRPEYVTNTATGQLHLPECEWTESIRVAGDDHPVFRQEHQGEGALKLQQCFAQCAR